MRHECVEGQSGAREIERRVKYVGEEVAQGVVRHRAVRQDSRRVIVQVVLLLGRPFVAPASAFGFLTIQTAPTTPVKIGNTRQTDDIGWDGMRILIG